MQAENVAARKQKIRQFITTYTVFILLCIFFFYWGFKKIPAFYQQDQTITVAQMNDFLSKTGKADTLVLQIQTKVNVKEKSMMAFYEWMNTLKEKYRRPLHHSVLDSYLKRVGEIENARKQDTSLVRLQQLYGLIKAETNELIRQNETLKQELALKKAQ